VVTLPLTTGATPTVYPPANGPGSIGKRSRNSLDDQQQ
jgi:hypothetical protein